MILAGYLLAVSAVYALLAVASPATASALLILFVALLLGPAALHDVKKWRRRHDR